MLQIYALKHNFLKKSSFFTVSASFNPGCGIDPLDRILFYPGWKYRLNHIQIKK